MLGILSRVGEGRYRNSGANRYRDTFSKDFKVFEIDIGETAKSIETVIKLCREWVDWGLTRSDIVIGLGGGMVTDVAAFAASIYHRGLNVINVPTTLLGMVDAAIGGKTGVNLPEGKNLIGTFWQPKAVICDINTLQTLQTRMEMWVREVAIISSAQMICANLG